MTLAQILTILVNTNPVEITARFVDLFNLASSTLAPGDQEAALRALTDARADNDEARERVREKLRAAQGG